MMPWNVILDVVRHSIGWTLLHFVWQAALIAGLFAVVGRRAGARLRCAAATLALLAMLAASAVTFSVVAREAWVSALAARDAASPAPVRSPRLAAAVAAATGSPGTLMERLETAYEANLSWLVTGWLAGVCLLSLRLTGGWLVLYFRVQAKVQPAAGELERLAADIARRLGLRKRVRILVSRRAMTPSVVGWLRPRILLPATCLERLAASQLEGILAHELAHVVRHDAGVNFCQAAAETLFFYHPAVWWISGVIRKERENCCDDIAVAVCGDRKQYAEALLSLEELRGAMPAAVLAAGGGDLPARLRRLLYGAPHPGASPRPVVLLFAAVLLAAVLGFSGQSAKPAEATDSASALHRMMNPSHPISEGQLDAIPPAYRKWLTADVPYIIQEPEVAAFLRLKTDAERDQFVEQFWQRRDPTPGTAENEYKDEHYRRILFANNRFADSRPGWRTDRGHVYIVLGPPDEIESHPADHRQSWRYRAIKGFASNVDFEFGGDPMNVVRLSWQSPDGQVHSWPEGQQ